MNGMKARKSNPPYRKLEVLFLVDRSLEAPSLLLRLRRRRDSHIRTMERLAPKDTWI